MTKKVLRYHMFDWVTELYFSEILPKTFTNLNHKNKIIDYDRRTEIEVGDENPYLKSLYIIYDGDKLLNNISDMVTRQKGTMFNPSKIESVEDLLEDFNKKRPNKSDLTRFYSHESQMMYHKNSKLINNYIDINEDDLIENGIPYDFMSSNGHEVPKYSMGSGVSAALVTTRKHPVGAVIIKKSEYLFGGKVVHLRKGKLIEEIYAEKFNQKTGELSIIHREYDSVNEFKETKTIRKYEFFNQKIKKHEFKPLQYSEIDPLYVIFPIGAENATFADSHFQ
jgi:hypothetical protein